MATVSLTQALRQHYQELFDTCIFRPERFLEVEKIIGELQSGRSRYQHVADTNGIPWFFIAVIHNMEANLDFKRHLHNGDPLNARTVHVPEGRPRSGNPPFTWEQSAVDALSLRNLGRQTDWRLTSVLYRLEAYNGWGYRRYHPDVLSPYLWSFSNHYKSGKYVADGRWSDIAVSPAVRGGRAAAPHGGNRADRLCRSAPASRRRRTAHQPLFYYQADRSIPVGSCGRPPGLA